MKIQCEFENIAFVGGPCSGKTSVLDAMKRQVREACREVCVSFIPEAATQILPRDPMLPRRDPLRFQYEVSLWQYMEEDRGIERLLLDPAPLKVQITDRGVADAYIYLSAEQVALMTDQTPQELASRYTAVLYFEPYRSEHLTDGNEYRVEREDEMAALEAKTRSIWEGHPHLYRIPTFDTIEERIAFTRAVLEKHIGVKIFEESVAVGV